MKAWMVGASLTMACGIAGAAPVTLAEVTNPPPYAWSGLEMDIIGITTGQKPDAVRKVLESHYKGQRIGTKEASFQLSVVSTTPFVTWMTSSVPGNGQARDMATIWFSSPASGNQAVAIERRLNYAYNEIAEAPRVADMEAALVKKYGKPTTTALYSMTWTLKAGASVTCKASVCTNGAPLSYAAHEFQKYEKELEAGTDMLIRASVTPQLNDKERVGSVVVSMLDIKRRGEAAKTDMDALRAENARQQKTSPSNMPKM